MMHLAAFFQSVNSAGALVQINPVADQVLTISGSDLRVPKDVPNLLAEAFLSAQTGPKFGQLQSPTLRQLAMQDVEPVAGALVFANRDQLQYHGDSPRALTPAESLDAYINATGGLAAGNYALVWLGDGPVKPSPGKIFSVRVTAAAALVAGTWVNSVLTFPSTLPAGSYQVVGARAEGTNLVAARFAFVGGGFRPGVPADTSSATNLFGEFRQGRAGVFGQFDTNYPPTMDFLGATDVSQVVVLDLIKSG